MYDVKLDEKYRIIVKDGNVRILRYDEEWLENPPGSKAWISAADTIEVLVTGGDVEKIGPERRESIAERVKKQLEKNGKLTDAYEIEALAEKFAEYVGIITSDSYVSAEEFVNALLEP